MTRADVRQTIADAVTAVDGATCTPYFTAATNAGSAFVRLDRVEYPNRFGGVAYWDVVIMLPQDLAAAEQYIDTTGQAVVEAVRPHLAVDRVSPQRLDIPGVGVLPVVFVSGHRED